MTTDSFAAIQERLAAFSAARDWDHFHTPKNLSMALAAEVGELLELYQWLTPEQIEELANDRDHFAAVADELADIAIYLLRLADVTGVDLRSAVAAKMARNESRFPPARVRGRADVAADHR